MIVYDTLREVPRIHYEDCRAISAEFLSHLVDESKCVDIHEPAGWVIDNWQSTRRNKIRHYLPFAALPFNPMYCDFTMESESDDGAHHRTPLGAFCFTEMHADDSTDLIICGLQVNSTGTGAITHIGNFLIPYDKDFRPSEAYRLDFDQAALAGATEQERQDIRDGYEMVLCSILAGISFFHCSNIVKRTISPTRQQRRDAQRRGLLPPKDYIEIHVPRIASISRGRSDGAADAPASFVRGHFKRYGIEGRRKLFGTVTGMWFWPQHRRGDGVPAQRKYRVHAPTAEHAADCIVSS